MKILVIDDEPIILRSLSRAASAKGHSVFTAADGEAGLQSWRDLAPDLVFLDVLMPKLTGPQVLQEIGPNSSRVILMSAYTGEYNLERAQSVGADLFVPKPFEDIFKLIEQAEELVGE